MIGVDEEIFDVVAEACTDRFVGRPESANPYNPSTQRTEHQVWAWAWVRADSLLTLRGQAAARRWLQEAS